jgi:hypothetical protein
MQDIFGGTMPRLEPLFPGDRGRKKIAQPGSSEQVFKPMRRLLEPTPSGDDLTVVQGKRSLRPSAAVELHRSEARHNPVAQARSGYDDAEQLFPWASKAQVSWGAKAVNARNFISTERILEVELGTKQKVNSRSDLRNGIPQANPGDKLYANVDYSPNFFYTEGLIPGSTIQQRRMANSMTVAQTARFYSGDGANFRPQPSYAQRMKAAQLRDEINSVNTLAATAGVDSDDD